MVFRGLVVEAAVVAVVCAAIGVWVDASDPGLSGVVLHPAWIAVGVIAARYGLSGFLVGLPLAWLAVVAAGFMVGGDMGTLGSRLAHPGELAALMSTLAVAWVGQDHQTRKSQLQAGARVAADRIKETQREREELLVSLRALRERTDRMDVSLAFMRDVACRLEGDDLVSGAEAALDLALARTGARAGIVQQKSGDALSLLAWRGSWTPGQSLPGPVIADATTSSALAAGGAVDVRQVDSAGVQDSDVAVPIMSDDEVVLGSISLRGVPFSAIDAARSEVSVVAAWVARCLAAGAAQLLPAALPAADAELMPTARRRRLHGTGAHGQLGVPGIPSSTSVSDAVNVAASASVATLSPPALAASAAAGGTSHDVVDAVRAESVASLHCEAPHADASAAQEKSALWS